MILLLICFEEGSGGICIYDYDYITHDSDQTVNIIEKGVVFQLGFSQNYHYRLKLFGFH